MWQLFEHLNLTSANIKINGKPEGKFVPKVQFNLLTVLSNQHVVLGNRIYSRHKQ